MGSALLNRIELNSSMNIIPVDNSTVRFTTDNASLLIEQDTDRFSSSFKFSDDRCCAGRSLLP